MAEKYCWTITRGAGGYTAADYFGFWFLVFGLYNIHVYLIIYIPTYDGSYGT